MSFIGGSANVPTIQITIVADGNAVEELSSTMNGAIDWTETIGVKGRY